MEKAVQELSKDISVLHEELENYFANTIIPQLFVDANLILRKFTPAAMKQFSLRPEDIGKHIHDIVHHIRYSTLIDNINQVISTASALEKEIQTTDTKWYQMDILPYIVRKENRTNGVIITFVDITARIIALNELLKLNKGYETFIYGVLHDIKQPLSKMMLLPDLLTEAHNSNDNGNFTAFVELLKNSAKNIHGLLVAFGDYVDNKTAILHAHESVNVEEIFSDVELALKQVIANDLVTIETQFQTSIITFSRTGLRSIIYNLVSNAIKYKKPDEPVKIIVSTTKTEDYVLLSVKDNGLGIDEQDHERIFNKFTRLSDSVEGTGMGLFIIKNMVENNGGMVKINSTPGIGSTFTVYFKN